jgi:sulfur carrier protein ThiS
MFIKVKILATLKYYFPDCADLATGVKFEFQDGTTVGEVLETLRLPRRIPIIAFVNGVPVQKDKILKGDDQVYLSMPVTGG